MVFTDGVWVCSGADVAVVLVVAGAGVTVVFAIFVVFEPVPRFDDGTGAVVGSVCSSVCCAGSTSSPEVIAPPELRTITPVPGASTVSEDSDLTSSFVVSVEIETWFVVVLFEGLVVGSFGDGVVCVDASTDDAFASVAVTLAVDDVSSAHAAAGVANSPPTPSAIARPPTRPMYLAYVVPVGTVLQRTNNSFAAIIGSPAVPSSLFREFCVRNELSHANHSKVVEG